MKRTAPYNSALTANVATNGVMRKYVFATPQTKPDSAPETMASANHCRRSPFSPPGYFETITAASDITPGTVRSRPPCWMTNVWPTAAMAKMEANEKTIKIELSETLPRASVGLRMNNTIVAGQMARN